MIYMNDFDIEEAVRRWESNPVLSRATRFLSAHAEQTNLHSDGWAHWSAPVKAAKNLQELIQRGDPSTTESAYLKALTPIKAFYTKRGKAAGMEFPVIRS